jgi:hypothetical protein
MLKQFLDGVMPIITQAIISILGILATFAIAQFSKYLTTKKESLVRKMGADQYSFYQSLAEAVYYGVEQQLKKAPGADKKAEFDKRLLAKLPGLTQEDLDHLRESIVGKVKASATILLKKPEPVPAPYPIISPFIQRVNPYIPTPQPVWYDTTKITKITCDNPGDSLASSGTITTTGGATVIASTWHPHLDIPETPIVTDDIPLDHEPEADK